LHKRVHQSLTQFFFWKTIGKLLRLMNFPSKILKKFSLQDATLAAAYSQLAASALGLSSIWIGMIDEEKVKEIIGTDLQPSSILCIGYPHQKRPPKSRRKLKDLVRVIE